MWLYDTRNNRDDRHPAFVSWLSNLLDQRWFKVPELIKFNFSPILQVIKAVSTIVDGSASH